MPVPVVVPVVLIRFEMKNAKASNSRQYNQLQYEQIILKHLKHT
jgi:hypothetical protein